MNFPLPSPLAGAAGRSPAGCGRGGIREGGMVHLLRARYLLPVSWDLAITLDQEDDGRWIADVEALPGCMVYGASPEEATSRAQALALHVLADRLEHGEVAPGPVSVRAAVAA